MLIFKTSSVYTKVMYIKWWSIAKLWQFSPASSAFSALIQSPPRRLNIMTSEPYQCIIPPPWVYLEKSSTLRILLGSYRTKRPSLQSLPFMESFFISFSEYTFRSIFFLRVYFQKHFLSQSILSEGFSLSEYTFRSIFFFRVYFQKHFLYQSILSEAFSLSEYAFRGIFFIRAFSSEYTFRNIFFIKVSFQKQFLCQSILLGEVFILSGTFSL